MAPNPLNYRSAPIAIASPSIVQVERMETGAVVVRVSLPSKTFQKMVMGGTIGAAIVSAMVIGFAVFGFSMGGTDPSQTLGQRVFVTLFAAFPAAIVIPLLVRWGLRLRRSYTFQADEDGITIQSYRGRREWSERLPREQISDVRIGFSRGGKGPSTAWLVIVVKPWYQLNRRLLHGYGGDNLACVADALRTGIGLPAHSWP